MTMLFHLVFISVLLIIPIYSTDVDCLCRSDGGEFSMVCRDSTCDWGWCGCSGNQLPCQSSSECAEVSCLCSNKTLYQLTPLECTITNENQTIRCTYCDDDFHTHQHPWTVYSFEAAIRRKLEIKDVYITAAKFSTFYNIRILHELNILPDKDRKVFRDLATYGLRRAVTCHERVLSTCCSDIGEEACLVDEIVTTTTAEPPIPEPCTEQIALMAGLFFAGFIVAILLLWAIFIVYNFMRRKKLVSNHGWRRRYAKPTILWNIRSSLSLDMTWTRNYFQWLQEVSCALDRNTHLFEHKLIEHVLSNKLIMLNSKTSGYAFWKCTCHVIQTGEVVGLLLIT